MSPQHYILPGYLIPVTNIKMLFILILYFKLGDKATKALRKICKVESNDWIDNWQPKPVQMF